MADELAPLLQAVAGGDKAALSGLYRALETPLYKFIRSRLNDPHEAADLHHDVFMEIWRKAGSFEGRSTVKTWVFGIAYRKVIDRFRKGARTDLKDEVPDQIDDAPNPEAALAATQEAGHVRHCLDELKDEHRLAVTLAFYQDLGYREIAEIAKVPEGTVKTRVYHAKQLLLRCLSGRGVEGAV
ncbi:MAG: sigma-70 family RNA polymerase sigma factor [Pseudomonadota bacterium]